MIKKLLKRRVVQDGILYAIANGFVQITSLIGVIFVARYLGPTNQGIYSFIQNYIAAFATILAGIDMYANWQIVKSENYREELRHYIRQKTIITLYVVGALVLASYIFLPKDIVRFIPFLCIPVLSGAMASSVFVVQYQNKSKLVAGGMMVSALLLLLAKIVAVLTKQSLIVFVAINSLDGAILIFLSYYYIFIYQKNKEGESKKYKPIDLARLFRNSVYGIIYVCFWFIVVRADQFIVPVYFDAYSLGIYSSAVKVIEITNVLILVINTVVLPRMLHILSGEGSSKRVHTTLLVYLVFAALATLTIQIFAPLAVAILFGPSFTESVGVLRVYSWSIPGLFVTYFFVTVSMSKNTLKVLATHSVVISALTLGSLFYIVRFMSILSIAWVSVIIYTISAASLYILWRKNKL